MFEFCLPTGAKVVPDSPDWIHEIKYDGYRLRVERDGAAADRPRAMRSARYCVMMPQSASAPSMSRRAWCFSIAKCCRDQAEVAR